MSSADEAFHESFDNIFLDPKKVDVFFKLFYKNFLAYDKRISDKFSNSDLELLPAMLKHSFMHLVEMASSHQVSPRLHEIATMHSKSQLNVTPELYDIWLEALLNTVEEMEGNKNPLVRKGWKQTLLPGITYMKSQF